MTANPDSPTANPTPPDVASPNTGHSTPADRRRRRGDSGSATSHASAPSAKRPRTSEHPIPSSHRPSSPPAARDTGAMLAVQKRPMGGRPAAKKLVIKNRRVDGPDQQAEVEMYFDSTWKDVDVAVQAILGGRSVPMPLDRVYRGVEDLCRNGREKEVYERLRKACERHLASVVLPAIKADVGNGDISNLAVILSEWKKFNQKMRLIRSTFSFLDRTYLRRQNECLQINDMMINQFRKTIYGSPGSKLEGGRYMGSAAVDGMCALVQADRLGKSRYSPALLRDSVSMLHVFGVYQKWFEGPFVFYSANFLAAWASERLGMDVQDYIKECLRLLDEESGRCDAYDFDSTTKRLLLQKVREKLVDEHAEKLLDATSFAKMVSGNEISSLSGLYELLEFADMVDRLKAPWAHYISSAGSGIVQDASRSDEVVTRLLELRQSLDHTLKEAFGSDEKFEKALREAFEEFMNDRGDAESGSAKIGEMIAKYMDMLLRGGLKALPRALLTNGKATQEDDTRVADEDGELDHQLTRAVALFRFVEGKDAFEAFYKRDLARRLLMDRSASQDAERTMLGKLKEQCGANFTHNLEQMFKDKALARDEMQAYKQSCAAGGYKMPFDLQVMVLSSAAWPSYPDIKVTLPPEVAGPIDKFDAFYKGKHSGRVLKWKHGLAHCVLRTRFNRGVKELSVSALQAVVLLLFDEVADDEVADDEVADDQPLGYLHIAQATGLSAADLTRTLQSLACGKTRVLTKHPRSRDVAETDTFTFNAGFWEPRVKIKINQIQMRETKEENKATHEKIVRDRGLETQAAIVRIMKSRKKLGHALLVAEVIEMTRKRGPVDAGQIKKEIENLIDKDFLEREGDSYTYLA